jgi:cobalt-zinc-cadmium efflux system outer membrane protein
MVLPTLSDHHTGWSFRGRKSPLAIVGWIVVVGGLAVSGCGRPWQLNRFSLDAAPGNPSDALATQPASNADRAKVTVAESAAKSKPSLAEALTARATGPSDPVTANASPAKGSPLTVVPASTQKERSKSSVLSDPSSLMPSGLVVDQKMTIQEALKFAIDNHPLLRSLKAEIEVAEAKLIDASLWPNPQLTLDTQTPTREAGATELSSRLVFTIPMAGRIGYAKALADAGIRRAQLNLSKEQETILFEAADAAVEVMYLQEAVKLHRQTITLGEKLSKTIKELAPTRGSVLDLHIADMNVAQLELEEYNSIAELTVARLRLSRAIGLDSPRLVEMESTLTDDPLPPISLERVLASVRETRPEIAESRAAVEEARRQIQLAQSEAVPDLEVGPRFDDQFRSVDDSMGARFQFDLPLFDRKQGAIAEGFAQLRVNQALVAATELTTINDVAAALVELGPLQARLEHHHRKIEPLREKVEKVLPEIFQAGQITAPQVMDELQRLLRLEAQHLDLRYRYNQLKVKLELFLGRPLASFAEPGAAPRKFFERKREPVKGDPFQDEPPKEEEVPPMPKKAAVDAAPGEPKLLPPAVAPPIIAPPEVVKAAHEAPARLLFPSRLQPKGGHAVIPDADSQIEPPIGEPGAQEAAAESGTME